MDWLNLAVESVGRCSPSHVDFFFFPPSPTFEKALGKPNDDLIATRDQLGDRQNREIFFRIKWRLSYDDLVV